MSKVTQFRRPDFVDFCPVCLDERKCHEAGRCLYDAELAKAQGERAPVRPLRPRINDTRGDSDDDPTGAA